MINRRPHPLTIWAFLLVVLAFAFWLTGAITAESHKRRTPPYLNGEACGSFVLEVTGDKPAPFRCLPTYPAGRCILACDWVYP